MVDSRAVNAAHAQPIRLCPRCDRSLAGLPPDAACPDCGLPFDERSRTWPARSLRAHRVSIAFLVLAAGAFLAMGVTRGDSLSWWMAGLFCIGLISHVAWHFATRRWRLSVGPGGILIRKARTQLLTWDQLRAVDQWRWTDQVPVHCGTSVRSLSIYEFLPDRVAVSSFRQCVRERQNQALGS